MRHGKKTKDKKKNKTLSAKKTKEHLSLHSLYLSHYTRASIAPMCELSHQ